MAGFWTLLYYLSENVDFLCFEADFDFALVIAIPVIALKSYWVDCSNLGVNNVLGPESIG